jgi:hypothetical protein
VRRARAAGVVLLLAAAAACLPPASARAAEVSAAQLRSLAAAAVDDPSALAELRRVDVVDGRRVDVRGALRGARGRALEERLRTLEQSIPEPGAAPRADPAATAREVLSERRFQTDTPRPFRGLIEWLGGLLPALDVVIPGPPGVVWVVLALLFGALAWGLGRRVLTRRIRASATAQAAAESDRDDPRALERRAAEAEAAGDLEAALRLRFRAGLLRLDARGAIEYRPSISTREVSRTLRSDDFDALASTFDDVVYGGRPADDTDVGAARERWPAVVEGDPRR